MKRVIIFISLFTILQLFEAELCNAQVITKKTSTQSVKPTTKPVVKKPVVKSSSKKDSTSTVKSTEKISAKATLLIITTMDCSVSVDGENVGRTITNTPLKLTVEQGEHLITCKTEDDKYSIKKIIEVSGMSQKIIELDLISEQNLTTQVEGNGNKTKYIDSINKKLLWARISLNNSQAYSEEKRQAIIEKIKEYILAGADINVTQPELTVPLLNDAVKFNSFELSELLLERGADANVKDKYSSTPLHVAIDKGSLTIIKLLLDNGANMNIMNVANLAPLHLAANRNKIAIAKLLIQYGANVNLRAVNGDSPLDLSASEEMKSLLRSYGAK